MVDIIDIVESDALEDRLTAQFILTLEHSVRNEVLEPFMKAINFGLDSRKDMKQIEFGLQVEEVNSIPDAKIEGDSFLVYIEVKIGDRVDSSQIERHFKGGKGRKPRFCVLCITGGLGKPSGVADAEDELKKKGENPNIQWTNWKKVHELMKGYQKRVKDEKSRFLIRSFNKTLEEQSLVGFTGFDKDEFAIAGDTVEKYARLLAKCNQLMSEVAEELKKRSIKQVGSYRNGRSNKELDVITYAEYWFNKNDWRPKPSDQWEDGSVAYIEFRFQDAITSVGVLVNGQTIYKKSADWKGLLQSLRSTGISYKIRNEEWTEAESKQDFLEKIEETKDDESLERVDAELVIESEELRDLGVIGIANVIVKCIEYLEHHDLFKLQAG